ncbi:MAG: hypothetical protein QM817_40320 [Archangium sp.]
MLLPMLLLLHAAPMPENTVALVSYQGAGRAAELTNATLGAITKEVEARGFSAASAAELEKQARAATMCGEDAECLATIGRVTRVGWVLAIGLGSSGKSTLFSAVLVEVATGKVRQRYESKTAEKSFDPAAAAKAATQTLFANVTLAAAPSVVEPVTPPVEPKKDVVDAPPPLPPVVLTPTGPRFRGLAIGLGIGAGVAAVTGATFSIIASQNYAQLPTVSASNRPAADGAQRAFNLTADVAIGAAVAAAVAMLIFILVDAPGTP